MIAANIDYLVLGCSHYPYLIPQIRKILPAHIQIIDSGEAVADKQKTYCKNNRFSDTSDVAPLFLHQYKPKSIARKLSDITIK
jgi:glutamate racemase